MLLSGVSAVAIFVRAIYMCKRKPLADGDRGGGGFLGLGRPREDGGGVGLFMFWLLFIICGISALLLLGIIPIA
jgi:hypothetical protein